MRRNWPALLVAILPAIDFAWNLRHLNIGLVDFYGLSAFAAGYSQYGAWPATPYFPAGYPLLLIPWGVLGSTLTGGYLLSALGIALALYSVWLLAAHMKAGQVAGSVAIMLCWAMPVCRVTAGSPSVDALYTGLGLWFLAAAFATWHDSMTSEAPGQGGQGTRPRWASMGLLVPALILPLLRYHAAVLIVPVLLVLLLQRRARMTSVRALLCFAAAVAFNYITYYLSYFEALASASLLQVWTGLELHYLIVCGSVTALWDDYASFSAYARHHSLLQTYGFKEIVVYWLANWVMFLRQPPVLLLLLLTPLLAGFRRNPPAWVWLGLLWTLAYTITLSCTYYTARAALLPAMTAVSICCTLSMTAVQQRWKYASLVVLAGVLLAGYQAASSFAAQDLAARRQFARDSRQLEVIVQAHKLRREQVYSEDWRLLPLSANPWTAPYTVGTRSWIDDPLIKREQRENIRCIDYEQRFYGMGDVLLAVESPNPENGGICFDGRGLAESMESAPTWLLIGKLEESGACVYVRGANSGAGVAPSAP